MKSFITAITIVLGTISTGIAHAECPESLPTEVMLDCIVVEGAGSEFDVQAALEEEAIEQKVMANKQVATTSGE